MAGNSGKSIKEVRIADPEAVMLLYKETGNVELRNQLVMHYLQYVNTAIYGMRTILLSNVPYDDFFNQGIIALIDCIERFDPDRGASFDTYSYLGVRGAILKYLRKQNWLPNRLWDIRKKIAHGRTELEFKLMREPSTRELAEYLEMTESQLNRSIVEMSVIDTVSFEELLENSYRSTITTARFLGDDVAEDGVMGDIMRKELKSALVKSIEKLPVRHRQIITLYYYENLNLREIGEVLDISPQRISQIRKKALEYMAKTMNELGYEFMF